MLCKFIRRIRIRQEKAENRIGKWLFLILKLISLTNKGLKYFTHYSINQYKDELFIHKF